MGIRKWFWVLCLFPSVMLGGCEEDISVCFGCPPVTGYLTPTSPENLINNLQESYLAREIEEYAKLLAPEYIFKVQPQDVAELGDFFTRDRDSTGTAALFNSPIVSAIRIALTHGAATAPTDTAFAAGIMAIRIQPTFLEVDETTGTTWQVDGDIQDLFFRRGNPTDGENPDHWVIIEWRDLPESTASAFEPSRVQVADDQPTTWGSIKGQYSK